MQDSHIGGPSHKVSAIIIALLSLGTLWVVTFKSGGHVDKILSSHNLLKKNFPFSHE